MIKTLAAAAVLSLGLAGYAMAQDGHRPAPAPAPTAEPMPTIITTIIITTTIIIHHMHHMAPEAAPARGPRAIRIAFVIALRAMRQPSRQAPMSGGLLGEDQFRAAFRSFSAAPACAS